MFFLFFAEVQTYRNRSLTKAQFGLGSRTCIGRHIGHLEMSKLLPVMVAKFDFELEEPDRKWKTINMWFVKPVDFRVRVRARQPEKVEA